MVTANISVLGLYVYDPTIFDGLAVPDGVNRETVVQNLLAELSGLEIIYPDAEFMRQFIPLWSAKELPVWQKLYNTTVLKYDPIMNYDRTESIKSKRKATSVNTNTPNTESRFKTAAYNSEVLETANSQTLSGTVTDNGTIDNDDTTDIRSYGNIGVTTTQQMIEQERETALFNIYDTIIQSFKYRFCVLVY